MIPDPSTQIFYEDETLVIHNGACEVLLSQTADASVDLIITDPPYGIAYKSNKPRRGGQFKSIKGDADINTGTLDQMFRVLKDNSAAYVFTRWDVQAVWMAELEKAGFDVRGELIWDKGGFAMGDLEGDWAQVHETIIYCTKGRHILNSPRPKSIITTQKVAPQNMIHPTEKPVGVWYPMISASSKPGDLVLDPYAGSCSSMLACRQTGRRGIGVEIDVEHLKRAEPRLNQIWGL